MTKGVLTSERNLYVGILWGEILPIEPREGRGGRFLGRIIISHTDNRACLTYLTSIKKRSTVTSTIMV